MADLIGDSAAIRSVRGQVWRLLEQFAQARRLPTVLLEGETGTGKGLVARMFHQGGPRATGPFVDVNCAAIPETLLEAELFGFERGAFTDARQAKPGLFQAAHTGVLFLDEIALLPRAIQVKLLKVIEERAVRRLGSTRSTPVDLWIIGASNEELAAAVREGRFREDLYHRVAGLTLRLPPLRERGEDIRLLADHFLTQACTEYGLPPKELTPEAVAALRVYPWPGNVRELNNAIERAVLLSERSAVTAAGLGLSPLGSPAAPPLSDKSPLLRDEIERVERGRLVEVLDETRWNISFAADRLGIPRNTLRYRMARYGLRPAGSPPRRRRTDRPSRPAIWTTGTATSNAPAAASRLEYRQIAWLQAEIPGAKSAGAVIARLHELVLDKVESFGGHVEELSASRVVAVFGLEPSEDAARRAAHAALAIRKATDRIQPPADAPVPLIVAVDSTSSVIEETNGTRRLTPESRQVGRARLAALTADAAALDVLASSAVAGLLERWFHLETVPRGERGLDEPIHRVLGLRRSAFEGGVRRRLSRFVGREWELALLQERVAGLVEGRGQVVGLVSEPGGGKSRLLYEFRQRLAGQRVAYLEGRCLSHASGIPYLPVLDLLRRAWELDEAEVPEVVATTIRRQVDAAGMAPEEQAPYLMRLFGIVSGSESLAALSPEAVKLRTFDTVRRIILRRDGPVVLTVEDLHWVDKTSEDFFASVVDTTPGTPLLFIATYRPGYHPPWIDRSYVSQFALTPLSKPESGTVVHALLPDVSNAVTEAIVTRGEGNPFFLEELTLAVAQQGERGVVGAVPPTIGEMLAARVDRLTDPLRQVLEAAAVLGREGPIRLLEAMLDQPPDLAERLHALVDREFFYEQSIEGGREYVFKHALIQEVAYARVLETRRKAFHLAAGRALEALNGDRLDEVLDRLAYHYGQTDDTLKAIDCLTRFAEKATAVYSLTEAVGGLELALAHAERLVGPTPQDHTIVRLVTQQAFPLILLGRFDDALAALTRHRTSADRIDDPRVTGPYYLWLGLVHTHTGNHAEATSYANRCIDLAIMVGDKPTQGVAHVQLSIDCFFMGQHRPGASHARQGLTLLDERSHGWWVGHAYWMLAWNLVILGDLKNAYEAASSAVDIGIRMAEPRLQAYGMSAQAWIAALRGNAKAALDRSERALAVAPDPLSTAVVLTLVGYVKLRAGLIEEALETLERAASLFQAFRFREMEVWAHAWLNEARLAAGDATGAEQAAFEMVAVAASVGFRYAMALIQRTLGHAALLANRHGAAARHLDEALQTFVSIEAHDEASRTRRDLSRVSQEQVNE